MPIEYLTEISEREHIILEKFDYFLDNFSKFLISLDLNPGYSWYLIEIEMSRLVPPVVGDVDILAGRLEAADPKRFAALLEEWKRKSPDAHPSTAYRLAALDLAAKGGLKWIPSFDYLVGIEVKCCRLPPEAPVITADEMKSTKSSAKAVKKIRGQIDKLSRIGFDKVGLFEFVTAPPADGTGHEPWHRASQVCGGSLDAMKNIFGKRLPEESFAGHGVCSISGIEGREEYDSGVYESILLRKGRSNPLLSEKDIKVNRREMERRLAQIFQAIPNPKNTPAIFVCDKNTHQVYLANEGIFRC